MGCAPSFIDADPVPPPVWNNLPVAGAPAPGLPPSALPVATAVPLPLQPRAPQQQAPMVAPGPATMQPPADQEPLGSPTRELVLSGTTDWTDGGAAPSRLDIRVMIDEDGQVFGADRSQGGGWEHHYRGRLVTTEASGQLTISRVYNSGMVLTYQVALQLSAPDDSDTERISVGTFTATKTVSVPGVSGAYPLGRSGSGSGTAALWRVKATSFVIGGEAGGENASRGWYSWDDENIKQVGFQVQFTVDRTGAVYGSNRNRAAGAERKRYRGSFRDGELHVDAVFESGQVTRWPCLQPPSRTRSHSVPVRHRR